MRNLVVLFNLRRSTNLKININANYLRGVFTVVIINDFELIKINLPLRFQALLKLFTFNTSV